MCEHLENIDDAYRTPRSILRTSGDPLFSLVSFVQFETDFNTHTYQNVGKDGRMDAYIRPEWFLDQLDEVFEGILLCCQWWRSWRWWCRKHCTHLSMQRAKSLDWANLSHLTINGHLPAPPWCSQLAPPLPPDQFKKFEFWVSSLSQPTDFVEIILDSELLDLIAQEGLVF